MAEAVVIDSPQSEPINPKVALLVIVAIVIVIVLLFYYFYKQGQGAPVQAPLPYDTTTSQNPNVSTPGASASQSQLTSIAQAINQDLTGVNIQHNPTPYQNALALSNTDFVALYNTYNSTYYPSGNGTMKTDIDGEWDWLWPTEWQGLQQSLDQRFASNQLS
jgi:hypothetical protein